MIVSPEDDAEVRRVSLTNLGVRARDIEVTSYAEIVLAAASADAAHPAFSNLFVQTECAPELDAQLSNLGIPPVKFGIGMNAGDVVAAHVGGGKRRQYDVVGDTVNLASRLCGQAGKGEIVLPEAMIARLPNPPEMEPMGPVALKGLDEPVMLFKVTVGESEPRVVAQRP